VTVRIALAVPPPHDVRLASQLAGAGHEVVARVDDGGGLVACLEPARPAVALVWGTPRYLSYAALAECDAIGVRVVAVVATDTDRRYSTGIGLHDVVPAESEWNDIESTVLGVAAPAPVSPPRPAGTVITVWGPSGAPGRTSVAIAIAAEIAAAGFSVALGDVDTHSASIAPSLGLMDEAPGFAAACRLAGANSLSNAELERIGQRYGGRGALWVLTGIGQPSRWPELSQERVRTTIEQCRRWTDYIVLDTASSLERDEEISSDMFAPRRNAATLTALADADHIVAVGSADPVGLSRFLRAHGDLADVASTEHVTVVANKVRSSAIGLGPHGQVAQTLSRFGGIDDPVLVPWDQTAFDAAVLSGRTLAEVAPRSTARIALRSLVADRLLPAGTPVARRRAAPVPVGWRRWLPPRAGTTRR
jgi:MinD-like ATPase involved in chromosome partitioning or flagellar assembly